MSSYSFNIIVVGGGFAGTASAVAAARQGKSVLLIEKYNCLGGAAAYNLVSPFMPYWTYSVENNEKVLLSKGLFSEILRRLEEMNGLRHDKMCFDAEILKYIFMKMAIESGVRLLFQTVVTGVKKEGSRIVSITASNVGGEQDFFADCFIDATGDANVAFQADCPYALGRESDRLCQPMTLCFRLGNVKTDGHNGIETEKGRDGEGPRRGEPCDASRIDALYRAHQKSGKIKNPREDVLFFRTLADNIYHFNTTRVVKRNPTDAFDVTRAEIEAREQVFEIYHFLKENFKEFKDSILLTTGIQIGVRESRKIIGEYVLTKEDILRCTRFEDSIAVCNYDIDIHSPDGSGTSHHFFNAGEYYTIPYRCLVPKNADNLLVAGRCISATHDAQASLRIMPTCCTLGEAAGVAAALFADAKKGAVGQIDIKQLQAILVAGGAKID
jgi:hypothetical protein